MSVHKFMQLNMHYLQTSKIQAAGISEKHNKSQVKLIKYLIFVD